MRPPACAAPRRRPRATRPARAAAPVRASGRSVATTRTRSARAASSAPTRPRSAQRGPATSATRRPAASSGGSPPTSSTSSKSDAEQATRARRGGDAREAAAAPCRAPCGSTRRRPARRAATFARCVRCSQTRLLGGEELLVEHAHLHRRPLRERRRLGREDQQPVRERHRAQHAGALVARCCARRRVRPCARARRARSAARPGFLRSVSPSTAATRGRNSARCPASLRSAGRTNCSKVTIADTGLPGRPNTSGPALREAAEDERVAGLDLDAPEEQPQPSFSSTGRT